MYFQTGSLKKSMKVGEGQWAIFVSNRGRVWRPRQHTSTHSIKLPSSAPQRGVSTPSFPPSYRTFQVLAVKAFSLGYIIVHQSCLLSTTGIPAQPPAEGRYFLNFFKMQIEMFEIANLLKQWPCSFKVIFTKYICSTMAEKNMGFGKKIVSMRIFFL